MSLTINGSGGGITASEAVALTGWNTIAEVPINMSGSITSGDTTLVDLSDYQDQLNAYGEFRYRLELTSGSISNSKSSNDYVWIGMRITNASIEKLFAVSYGYTSWTSIISKTRPVTIGGEVVVSNTRRVYYAFVYPSSSCVVDYTITKYNLLLMLGKASGSSPTYAVSGTIYLEARY